MSHSPASAEDESELGKYRAGWQALNTMLGRGGSFSGRERNCAFLNCTTESDTGRPSFANVSALSGFDFPDDARGIALVDWDQDGDLDLWVSNRTAPRLRYLDNALGSATRSVALLLEGATCNRDAIGARVVLETESRTITRTLAAGHGYLSQSSKWLHFGLGEDSTVKAVEVHWPGRRRESFTGVSVDGRFLLKQGKRRALAWRRPDAQRAVSPSPNHAPAAGSIAHVRLPRRIPMPDLAYTAVGDSQRVQIEPGGKPLLLLLFASWCPHCRAELKELVAQEKLVRTAGLEILALAVDELSDGGLGSRAQANQLLNDVRWPFLSGVASADMLAKIEHLTDALFELRTPFAVPYSFLLDPHRDLVSIYRGPIQLDVLRHDAATCAADLAMSRDLSVPFPGKWYTQHPGQAALLELLADHFQRPFPADALRYLEKALPHLTAADGAAVRERLAQLHASLGGQAIQSAQHAEAERHFRAALAIGPESARIHHDLGIALFNQGKLRESESAFLNSLRLAPGNPSATRNLESVRRALSGAK